ncbi:MAG: hypothetical protein H6590_05175 [Flavobacteriales bacterium]|nr:hypothetical protein [Flavobacteriales bacterium]
MQVARRRNRWLVIGLVLFTGLNTFLAFNHHSHGARHSYHGALWADRAGYFSYLPATFKYGFHAAELPAGLDTLTGNGFVLDAASNTLRTKYTSGVAMLQAPFYLAVHAIGSALGMDPSAYGSLDHAAVLIAGPVYASLGLVFLFLFLGSFAEWDLSLRTRIFLLFALFAGSNLFYYAVFDPGMSHVYSFFLFTALLLLWRRVFSHGTGRFPSPLTTGLVIGLITLIRPTNLIFVASSWLIVGLLSGRPFSIRPMLNDRRGSLLIILAALVVWIPQMIYWKFAFGSYLVWSYPGEGFTEWAHPHVAQFLFSTNNGLLPYVPLFMVLLAGTIAQWAQGSIQVAALTWITFGIVALLGSSWWVWHFGCGYGSRTMVEYLAFFAPALFAFHQWMARRGSGIPSVVLLSLLILLQLKMVHSYGSCWFQGDWNWAAYTELIFGPTK